MSSINGNNSSTAYSDSNGGQVSNTQQIAEENLALQVRKNTEKALSDNEKNENQNIIQMAGMTPTEAAAAMAGTSVSGSSSTASGKSNKYSATGAVNNLPAPAAPKSTVTAKTQALYSSMHSDINTALGTAASGEKAINYSTLTPTLTATSSASDSAKAVAGHTAAAMDTINTISRQFAKVSSGQMTMAFLMLRAQGQTDGLNINNQMGDMQNAIREADLNQQIKSDKEAQKKLDKAAKKQAAMKKVGPIIEAVIAVLTAVITVLSAGTATGLAIVLAAMAVGFVAGGAIGGKKNGNGFDFNSAITGMSVGSMVMPAGAMLNGILKAITKAVEDGVEMTIKNAAKAVTKTALKAVGKGGSKAAGEGADAVGTAGAKAAEQTVQNNVAAHARDTFEKTVQKAEQRATGATKKVGATEAQAGAQAGDQAPTFLEKAATNISSKIAEHMPKEVQKVFETAQKAVDKGGDLVAKYTNIPKQKLGTMIEMTIYGGNVVSQIAQAGGNFAINEENIAAQKDLLAGKMYGQGAKVAQDSYKNTQDFLSSMQDQHNTGISQIQTVLQDHNRASSLAISNISA